jgi:O-antigen ligase
MQNLPGKTEWWYYRAIFGFYAFLLTIKSSYSLFGAAAASLGIIAATGAHRLRLLPLDALFTILIASFPLSLIPSLLANGGSWDYFDYPLRALLFIPLILGLRAIADVNKLQFFLYAGAGTGGLLAGIFTAKSLFLDQVARVGYPIANPIPFGQAATILALLSFVGFFQANSYSNKTYLAAGYIGASFAVYGSGSAGSLLGLGAGLGVELIFLSRSLLKSVKRIHIIILLIIGMATLLPLAVTKFAQISQDIQEYNLGRGMATSQGARLMLISLGLESFYQHPLLGVGPGNGSQVIADYCRNHVCTPEFSAWKGAHNQYVDILMSAGIIGLAGWLTFSIGMAYLFLTRILSTKYAGAPIAGLAIVIAMMTSAFPQPLYNHSISIAVFIFTVSLLWYASYQLPHSQAETGQSL